METPNYFSLYEIPESFSPDTVLVKKKFYELSKRFHPDFYVNESEEKQAEILELSTVNNKAYQVLSNPLKRIEYILGMHGMIAEGDKYVLPQNFLMEMMDVNEALMDLQMEPDQARLMQVKGEVDHFEAGLFDELKTQTDLFDSTSDNRDEILSRIRDIWYRQKYLMRIKESLSKFQF